jgi:phosphatidylserine/phosphatidylglycerophosphate/cardiolipin synthase-like enzyme
MFDQHRFGSAPAKTDRIPNPVVTLHDGAIVENYFTTHDGVAERIIKQIGLARRSIHFLAFSFTHDGIGQAMLQRAQDGVLVRGVFERTQAGGKYSEYDRFRQWEKNVEVYLDANPRNMHHKVIIIDGQVTIAGSFNFSDSADRHNDENVVIIRSAVLSRQFEEEFQTLFKAAKNAADAEQVASAKK